MSDNVHFNSTVLENETTTDYGRAVHTPIFDEINNRFSTLNKISTYKSEFDLSVYRNLEIRYPNARGGFIFKTPLKLVNHHSSCTKCHYAFELDTYGRGCFHNCTYCYALEQLTAHGYWNRPQPFPIDITELWKTFQTVFETDKNSKWRSILEKRVPLRIGSMSDSFMKMDINYGVTKEVLKILNHYEYPHIIFTRSNVIARDEYLSELRPDLCSVQFSISGNNEKLTRAIEPGAPSYTLRLEALEKVSSAGIWTTVRINPFFPIFPDGYYTNPDSIKERFGSEEVPKFDLFDWNMLDDLKSVGTKGFLVGVVRLSPAGLKAMERASGIRLSQFFIKQGPSKHHDLKYSDAEVAHYYRLFHREARSRGLRFNTCFIGMGLKDYYEYQDLWSNKSDCCDVKGNVETFKVSSQEIAWAERLKHTTNKTYSLEAQLNEKSIEDFYSSKETPRRGPLGVVNP